MFNIRLDKLWPWIRFKPPSDEPPGFGMAPDGSIRSSDSSDLGNLGHVSDANDLAPVDIGFGGVYRPAGGGNPFGSINLAGRFGPIVFGSRPSAPNATSFLFPQPTEAQALWLDSESKGGELDSRTDKPAFGFGAGLPDDPPSFRIAAGSPERNGSPNDSLTSFGYDPRADVMPPTGIASHDAIRPAEVHGSPFEFLHRRHLNNNPIPSFSGGLLPPYATSFLFPRVVESQFTGPGLQDDGEFDAGPDRSLPGFRLQPPVDTPPGFRVAADDLVRGALPDDFGLSSFGYHPQSDAKPSVDVTSADGIRPVEDAIYPATYPVYDPIYFPAPLRDPVKSHGSMASTGRVRTAAQLYSAVADPPID